jgi:lactoylglutathione lyase
VAFDVSDLAKARAFYEDFLGFAEYGVLPGKDGSVRMVFIKINDDQHIELFTDPPSAGDGRLNHVAFYTDNAPQMREYLASRGVKVPERVGKGKTGDLNFEFKDPDGHRSKSSSTSQRVGSGSNAANSCPRCAFPAASGTRAFRWERSMIP